MHNPPSSRLKLLSIYFFLFFIANIFCRFQAFGQDFTASTSDQKQSATTTYVVNNPFNRQNSPLGFESTSQVGETSEDSELEGKDSPNKLSKEYCAGANFFPSLFLEIAGSTFLLSKKKLPSIPLFQLYHSWKIYLS